MAKSSPAPPDLHQQEIMWLRNPLFAAAGEDRCAGFAQHYPARREMAGASLASAGDTASELFVVLEGTVRLFHTAPDGRELTVKLLRAPNTAGTLEVLHDIPRLTDIATVDQAVIARFPQGAYLEFIEGCPKACFQQVKHIAAAFLVAARKEQQAFTNLSARVASLLLAYGQYFGREDHEREDRGLVIDHPLTQQDIANGVGTVRRSVAGLMATWREEGVLTKRRGRLVLLDMDYLKDTADLNRDSLCYEMGMPLDPLYRPDTPSVAILEVTAGRGSMLGRQVEVKHDVILGNSPPATFLLADDFVCNQHCRVFRARTGGRLWVEDLGSKNGTAVNGKTMRRAVLSPGDIIKLGGTSLTLRVSRANV